MQVFFLSLFLAIFAFKKQQSWHWVAVGLLTDFCLRFYVRAAGWRRGWGLQSGGTYSAVAMLWPPTRRL